MHTLILDERAGIAHALQTILRSAGYQTTIAHTVDAARAALDADSIRLILLADDVRDGRIKRLPARLRTECGNQYIPVIVYSDELRLANADYVRWLGADAVWESPFSADDLLAMIGKLVHRQTA